jgi:hypothetical protein
LFEQFDIRHGVLFLLGLFDETMAEFSVRGIVPKGFDRRNANFSLPVKRNEQGQERGGRNADTLCLFVYVDLRIFFQVVQDVGGEKIEPLLKKFPNFRSVSSGELSCLKDRLDEACRNFAAGIEKLLGSAASLFLHLISPSLLVEFKNTGKSTICLLK